MLLAIALLCGGFLMVQETLNHDFSLTRYWLAICWKRKKCNSLDTLEEIIFLAQIPLLNLKNYFPQCMPIKMYFKSAHIWNKNSMYRMCILLINNQVSNNNTTNSITLHIFALPSSNYTERLFHFPFSWFWCAINGCIYLHNVIQSIDCIHKVQLIKLIS